MGFIMEYQEKIDRNIHRDRYVIGGNADYLWDIDVTVMDLFAEIITTPVSVAEIRTFAVAITELSHAIDTAHAKYGTASKDSASKDS